MLITLAVTSGPLNGRTFTFEGHDVFLVGRSPNAHARFPEDDPFFSRVHFLIEVNPPRCRLTDMGSRNGTFVNGKKVEVVDLDDGDEIRAGHTRIQVRVEHPAGPAPRFDGEARDIDTHIAADHIGDLVDNPNIIQPNDLKPGEEGDLFVLRPFGLDHAVPVIG